MNLPPQNLLREEIDVPLQLADVVSVARAPLTAALGTTPNGEPLALDIAMLPHLAVAGTTGSGKSTLLRSILASLLTVCGPEDLQLFMVDLTDELDDFSGIPHLRREPVDEPGKAADVLEDLVNELEERYTLFRRNDVRNITQYNAEIEGSLPRVLCVVDEFAELMLGDHKKRIERAVARLGIRGRKCGIHLIVATQIPHASVLTPVIKANMNGRIALALPSAVFSRVALDQTGADQLRGNGDGLLRDGHSPELKRFQTAFVSRDGMERVVAFWRQQMPPPKARASFSPRPPRPMRAPVPEFAFPKATRALPVVKLRKYRRGRTLRVFIAGFVTCAAIWVVGHLGTAPSACPPGSVFQDTTLEQYCETPSGRTACVISAAGLSPLSYRVPEGTKYSKSGPDGRWCSDATTPR